jgi:MFS family permease
MDRWGRRSLLSALMLLGGLSCIIAAYIPGGKHKYDYIYSLLYLFQSIKLCTCIPYVLLLKMLVY